MQNQAELSLLSTLELRQQRNRARRLLADWGGSHTGARFLSKQVSRLTSEITRRIFLERRQSRLLAKLRNRASARTAIPLAPLPAIATPSPGSGNQSSEVPNGPQTAFNEAV